MSVQGSDDVADLLMDAMALVRELEELSLYVHRPIRMAYAFGAHITGTGYRAERVETIRGGRVDDLLGTGARSMSASYHEHFPSAEDCHECAYREKYRVRL